MSFKVPLATVGMNEGRKIPITVPGNMHGSTLIDLLRTFKSDVDQRWFEEERFTREDKPIKATTILAHGDVIQFQKPPWVEPPVPSELEILHEDDDLLAVEKPAGIPVTPTGMFYRNSLVHLLRKHRKWTDISPIHRLDMETTGILAFAKTRCNRSFFQKQFTLNHIQKEYIALTKGHFPSDITAMDDFLKKMKKSAIRSKWQVSAEDGFRCQTRVLHSKHHIIKGKPFTTLVLVPLSGRTNQLRAQLAARGFPIVGDKKYHPDEGIYLSWFETRNWTRYSAELLLPGHALHAEQLVLQLPGQLEALCLKSNLNPEKNWLKAIEKTLN